MADGSAEYRSEEYSGDARQESKFTWNADAYNAVYESNFESLEQAYSAVVTVGSKTLLAPTHLFGAGINVIPYSNDDGTSAADGHVFRRGDSEIAKVFGEGELGIAVKHRRSEYPKLDLNIADARSIKQHVKLLDTHVGIVVGVERDGMPGAITINNPQAYERGYFGDEKYAMIFLRPIYPRYLRADQIKAFEANIRTMLIGFNAVTKFPGNYDSGDPLGARTLESVRAHVKNMVLALNGDKDARDYFKDPANRVYCAELAYIGFTSGLMVPLNDETMIPLVGETAWTNFKGYIESHNAGQKSPFTTMNRNNRVKYVTTLSTAPKDLRRAGAYGPVEDAQKLAFQPMMTSDMVEQFVRTHLPREILGEALAEAQAAALAELKPGLLEQLLLDDVPENNPNRIAAETLYDRLIQVLSTSYGSYNEFRADLKPLLRQARLISGPRSDTGAGLFVPPSLYHVIAQGQHPGGLLRLQYVGHGIHQSMVQKIVGRVEPEPRLADDVTGTAVGKSCCAIPCTTKPTFNRCDEYRFSEMDRRGSTCHVVPRGRYLFSRIATPLSGQRKLCCGLTVPANV